MFDPSTQTSDYMSVIVTHECNRRCPFCIDKQCGQPGMISMDSIEKAIRFGKEHGIRDILLVGGEPTLHPDIHTIAQRFSLNGFKVILTSNFDDLNKIYDLDPYVDCFNMSNYGQQLPDFSKIQHADLTLSTLIYKHHLNTREALDEFIDRLKSLPIALKFSTLSLCNDFTKNEQEVNYLDELPGERLVLFNEILGQIYRGQLIKRYDRVVNPNAAQSYKCHPDGTISQEW